MSPAVRHPRVFVKSQRQAGFFVVSCRYLDDKVLSVSPRRSFSESPNPARLLILNLLLARHLYPCISHGLGQPQVCLDRHTPYLKLSRDSVFPPFPNVSPAFPFLFSSSSFLPLRVLIARRWHFFSVP